MRTNLETMLNYFIQIRKYYANILNKRLKEIKLSPNEINILILLSNNPSITTSTQLNVFLGVSKGLISRSIDSLMKKGWIRCENDPSDRRVQRIYLTSDSTEVIDLLKREIEKINHEILSDVSEAEMDAMEQTMKKIIQRFKENQDI